MGVAIAYDKPVKDLIAGLDATGHVTHTAYRKTSVTFHHNGGRLSHEGCLEVWKTREASAHFDVDGQGAVAQYVRLNEYAWHAGNTQGNKESVGIEMADATLGPDWTIADVTWREAARLAGWIFARAFGIAPTRETVHVHHDWKATTCAGPFIDGIREQLFQAVLAAYNQFAGATPAPAAPAPSNNLLPLDQIAHQVIAGSWSSGDDRVRRLRGAGYDPDQVQAEVNRQLGAAPAPAKKSLDEIAQEVINGDWGNNPQRGQRLADEGYSPTDVQAAVNRKLGANVGNAPTKLSISLIASQVIAGQWSSGQDRAKRLSQAGYDAAAVQAEVNRRLLKR